MPDVGCCSACIPGAHGQTKLLLVGTIRGRNAGDYRIFRSLGSDLTASFDAAGSEGAHDVSGAYGSRSTWISSVLDSRTGRRRGCPQRPPVPNGGRNRRQGVRDPARLRGDCVAAEVESARSDSPRLGDELHGVQRVVEQERVPAEGRTRGRAASAKDLHTAGQSRLRPPRSASASLQAICSVPRVFVRVTRRGRVRRRPPTDSSRESSAAGASASAAWLRCESWPGTLFGRYRAPEPMAPWADAAGQPSGNAST
jgi:hypothetical protein